MNRIEWNDSYSVGDSDIDEQHKKWVSIYNDIYDYFDQKSQEKSQLEIMDTLKSIVDYTRYHFDYEREYMKSINYPLIVEHLRKHKEFDNLVYKISRNASEGKIILYSEMMTLIRHWFLNHILEEDKKYGRYANEQKV